MTDTTHEAESSTDTSRPVRVPNVSAGAISGLGHHVIGAAAGEVYDAEASYDTDDDAAGFDLDNPTHVEALVGLVPEERQEAVRQALTGEVIDGQVVTHLEPVEDPGPRVDGTQQAAGPDSSLTGDGTPVPESGDPTNGAAPTGDTYTVADYTVDQVNDYLDKYPAATEQVLAAEADGQARVGILHGRHGTPKADD